MIFYTADLHLGYFPILHDTARPFTGVPEMDEALISHRSIGNVPLCKIG